MIISIAPVVALIMIWTRYPNAGLWLMLLSMFGSFVFGCYHHFIELGTDNVSLIPAGDWRLAFQITAVLLAFIEAAGCILSIFALRTFSDRKAEGKAIA